MPCRKAVHIEGAGATRFWIWHVAYTVGIGCGLWQSQRVFDQWATKVDVYLDLGLNFKLVYECAEQIAVVFFGWLAHWNVVRTIFVFLCFAAFQSRCFNFFIITFIKGLHIEILRYEVIHHLIQVAIWVRASSITIILRVPPSINAFLTFRSDAVLLL